MSLRPVTCLALFGALSEFGVSLLSRLAFDVYRELQDSLTYVYVFAPLTYALFFAVLFFKQEAKKTS